MAYELHLALITVLTFTKFVASALDFELTKDYIVLFLPVINYLSLESRRDTIYSILDSINFHDPREMDPCSDSFTGEAVLDYLS